MIRTALVSVIALLVAWIGLAEPTLAQAPKANKRMDVIAKAPTRIEVIANDYAFLPLPANIAAGPTIFIFENRGKVWHEVHIVRLNPGVTLEQFTKVEQFHRKDLYERSVGILIGGPGTGPDGEVLVNLIKGSTYVAFCGLRDTPDAPQHLTFGMYTTFTPR